MQVKKWYTSKTLWVGALEIVGAFGALMINENLSTEATIVMVDGVLKLALRFVTSKGIVV